MSDLSPYYVSPQTDAQGRPRAVLYCGDAVEFMREGTPARFSHFATDPPYTAAGGSTNGRSSSEDNQFFSFWLEAVGEGLRRAVRPDGCGFMFCDWRTVGLVQDCLRERGSRLRGAAWSVSQALVWDRESFGMGAPFRNGYEMIAFAKSGGWDGSHIPKNISTVLRHRYTYTKREHHGAEKPVELMEQLLDWTGASPKDAPVFDPFAGSGSTLIAAVNKGLTCVGVELDEANCETAAKRIDAALSQTTLFPASAVSP